MRRRDKAIGESQIAENAATLALNEREERAARAGAGAGQSDAGWAYQASEEDHAAEGETYYGAPEPEADPYASIRATEQPAAPAVDPVQDPYAAFNHDPSRTDPYTDYRQAAVPRSSAPSVDFGARGRREDTRYDQPAATGAAYGSRQDRGVSQGQRYDQPQADPEAGYALESDPYGSYADPTVAAAAAEAAPYSYDDDYPTFDTDEADVEKKPRKSRKTLVFVAAAAGVVVVGGLIAWGFGW